MPLIEGTRNIVEAIQAAEVQRYIGMATPSLRDPRDEGGLLSRVVPFMGRTFLKRAYRELLEMSQLVIDSPLNWTIARFTRPTDGARTETVRPASSAATRSAPASPVPISPASSSSRPPTRGSTALLQRSATDPALRASAFA
jgi:hypothetical protein